LHHFYPGSSVLSFGTAGCNLGCRFCQNWDISKARTVDRLSDAAAPDAIAKAAADAGCRSVAYTYNDPVIFAEYAMDTAAACHARGVKNVVVSAGYITERARAPFFSNIDAANIDLKAFTEDFYRKLCFAELAPVLDTLRWIHEETDVWLEVTTLLIPDANDSAREVGRLSEWILEHLGPSVPLHFSAFHPDFKLTDRPRTPPETLQRARRVARAAGLQFVYTGNVHDEAGQSTYCPECGETVIARDWYELGTFRLNDGRCANCAVPIPGCFDASPGTWGPKRRRLRVS
ncbi:MAG: AmmeMemoRadiSam system radical SAM enzyme, partial [Myxococcota bacterium]